MPTLLKTVIQDWRNIALQEIEFSPKMNCISGGNGEGKTNLLDAVYYLSMTRSSLSTSDKYNYRRGCDSFALAGSYRMEDDKEVRYTVRSSSGADKKFMKDGKPYTRISDHIGELPIVMVSPSDSDLISDSSECRRRFCNSCLSQMDKEYLSTVQRYNKYLASRNALLKQDNPCSGELLESIDARLSLLAQDIYERRAEFTRDIRPLLSKYYSLISGGRENVDISYRSDLDKGTLESQLAAGYERDRILGYTTAGIHRDDFIFGMEGDPIRKIGSEGQQKSFLIALKFSQNELMRSRYGYPPILLLDDLFDKLDPERSSNLLSMVSGKDFGQIFISDTDKERIERSLANAVPDALFLHAQGGAFSRQ